MKVNKASLDNYEPYYGEEEGEITLGDKDST